MQKIMLFTIIMMVAMATKLNAQNKGSYKHILDWTYWQTEPVKYEMKLEESQEFTNQNVFTIKSVQSKIKGFGTLMKTIGSDLYKGKTIKMSGYVKSKNVKSWAGLWMRVDYYKARVLAFDNMQERAIKGSKEWEKYEVVLFVPAEATSISYGVLLAGTGQIWFKDVMVEIVADTVPETGSNKGRERKTISFERRAQAIGNQIKEIIDSEKNALKTEIDSLDKEVVNGRISKEKAESLKLNKAEIHAANIETKVSIEEKKLSQLVQDKVDGKLPPEYKTNRSSVLVFRGNNDANREIGEHGAWVLPAMKEYNDQRDKDRQQNKRTSSQVVFAIGSNNVVTDGAVSNSDFKYWQSRFYELGLTFNSRIISKQNLLHFKYGLSLMYNDLQPTDNRIFVDTGSQTVLETNPLTQECSRFRNVNLVAPLHLEFDFTKPKIKDGKTYFKSHNSFRIGLGGYLGANLKSKQIIKYDLEGYNTTVKTRGDFNTTDFIYGLSTYVSYKATGLYLKYDLNPLFKDNLVKQNNISLGLRFDFN